MSLVGKLFERIGEFGCLCCWFGLDDIIFMKMKLFFVFCVLCVKLFMVISFIMNGVLLL